MRRTPTIVALIAGAGALIASDATPTAGEALELDRWYQGTFNGQPSASLHSVVLKRADGTRRTLDDMAIVFQRTLGAQSIRLEIRQSSELIEDADGRLTDFRLDEDENGDLTAASGRVDGREVVATVHRLDRSDTVRLPIPAGVELLGQRAGQEALVRRDMRPGDHEVSAAPQLLSGTIAIITSTATLKQVEADGSRSFDCVADVMPIPMQLTVDARGDLQRMALTMGPFAIEFRPSDQPVTLMPAELASVGLVSATGHAPTAAAENRFRLPRAALAALPDDPFQRRDGDVIVVSTVARDEPPTDTAALLKAEPHLELDDPALRAWVADVVQKAKDGGARTDAEIAEQLRLAVRSRIVHKDLSQADGSALSAFREQRGDCTEHANLLCAALRIAGFPARAEVGLVYAGDYGAWVGHAWNSAWIDGRWLHLDSAYPGIARSEYLKLGTASGQDAPGTMAALVTALANVLGQSIATVDP